MMASNFPELTFSVRFDCSMLAKYLLTHMAVQKSDSLSETVFPDWENSFTIVENESCSKFGTLSMKMSSVAFEESGSTSSGVEIVGAENVANGSIIGDIMTSNELLDQSNVQDGIGGGVYCKKNLFASQKSSQHPTEQGDFYEVDPPASVSISEDFNSAPSSEQPEQGTLIERMKQEHQQQPVIDHGESPEHKSYETASVSSYDNILNEMHQSIDTMFEESSLGAHSAVAQGIISHFASPVHQLPSPMGSFSSTSGTITVMPAVPEITGKRTRLHVVGMLPQPMTTRKRNNSGSGKTPAPTGGKKSNNFIATTANSEITPGEFGCHQCAYRTTKKHLLYQHIRNSHSDLVVCCQLCEFTTRQKHVIEKHYISKHQLDSETALALRKSSKFEVKVNNSDSAATNNNINSNSFGGTENENSMNNSDAIKSHNEFVDNNIYSSEENANDNNSGYNDTSISDATKSYSENKSISSQGTTIGENVGDHDSENTVMATNSNDENREQRNQQNDSQILGSQSTESSADVPFISEYFNQPTTSMTTLTDDTNNSNNDISRVTGNGDKLVAATTVPIRTSARNKTPRC